MQKIIRIASALLFSLFVIVPVVFGQANDERKRKPVVLATMTIIADIAAQIGGDKIDAQSVMPTGGDPHVYDPTPEDAKRLANADMILRNGLTLEGWLDKLIDNSGSKARIVTVTAGVPPIASEEYENAYDPHAWMNPEFGIQYAKNIAEAFATLDPENSAYYQKNYARYKQQLQALDREIAREINRIPPKNRVLVTSHDAFRYFARRYGMTVLSVLGTTTDADAQTQDVKALSRLVREQEIPAIFVESTVNPKLLKQIASDNGATVGGRLFADSLGDEESGANSYVSMLRQNTRVIVAGLLGEQSGAIPYADLRFIAIVGLLFVAAFVWVARNVKTPGASGLQWRDYRLDVEGLWVSYERKTALANIYLELEPGFVYGLVGPNGSGKTTLFKSILGLVKPDAGKITLNGRRVELLRKETAYIPQREEIDWTFPATVADVVATGRFPRKKIFSRLDQQDYARVDAVLKKLEINALRDKSIGKLSGGQQQRAFIARALCQDAEVYLFDEPFVGVDVTTEEKIIEIIKELAAQGKMIVIIHHDLSKVSRYFDRLILINQHIVASGSVEEVFTEENISRTFGGVSPYIQQAHDAIEED